MRYRSVSLSAQLEVGVGMVVSYTHIGTVFSFIALYLVYARTAVFSNTNTHGLGPLGPLGLLGFRALI